MKRKIYLCLVLLLLVSLFAGCSKKEEKKIGRPTKEPFEPYKEIPENVHQAALDAAFANGNISNYNDYLERLKIGYGLQDVNLGHNKAVKVATFLRNKRMVIKVGKEYQINPEYHY